MSLFEGVAVDLFTAVVKICWTGLCATTMFMPRMLEANCRAVVQAMYRDAVMKNALTFEADCAKEGAKENTPEGPQLDLRRYRDGDINGDI